MITQSSPTIPGQTLKAIPLPGLTLDTLGLYFAALGLLRLLSRKWPQVRGCWRQGVFTVVGGPDVSITAIEHHLQSLNAEDLVRFRISWSKAAEESGKNMKSKRFVGDLPTLPLLLFRSISEEACIELIDMHLVVNSRSTTNPIFRNPGGKRKPHDHWGNVVENATKSQDAENSLRCVLFGETGVSIRQEKWNAGTWFPVANKIYNYTGLSLNKKKPMTSYVDNGIPSWAVLLAVHGFLFSTGSTSRKLGANTRGLAAFPFTTLSAAPTAKDQCGKSEAEFWAPVWHNPLSVREILSVFLCGKSEIGSKAATTSGAFAAAITARGVDLGLNEFRRFEFSYSTGDKTFEAIQTARVPLKQTQINDLAIALIRICALRDNLPRDEKKNGKWRFKGLQGPLDRALLTLAQAVGEGRDKTQFEAVVAVLDAAFGALEKVDRNKAHREAKVRFERLPLSFLAWIASQEGGTTEFRLALAVASVKEEVPKNLANSKEAARLPQAFLAYRLGATGKGRYWEIPKDRPLRSVWGPRSLVDNLCSLAHRRLIESPSTAIAPFRSRFSAPLPDVLSFLKGGTDDALLARWIDRLSLFHWSDAKASADKLRTSLPALPEALATTGSEAALYNFFRPLLHDELLRGLATNGEQWKHRPGQPILATTHRVAPVLAALERDDTGAAWTAAKSAFHAQRIPVADFGSTPFAAADPRRLLATLILPAETSGLYRYFRSHWQSPSQPKTQTQAI